MQDPKEDKKASSFFSPSLYLSVAVVLTVLLWGFLQARQWAVMSVEQADRQTLLVAREIASEIGIQLKDYAQLVEALSKHVEEAGPLEPKLVQKMVTAQKRPFKHFSSVMFVGKTDGAFVAIEPLTDPSGAALSGIQYKDRDYYRAVVESGQTFIGPFRSGRGLPDLAAPIAAPIHDREGQLVAVAMGSIKLAYIQAEVEKILTEAKGLKAVVMDREGRSFLQPGRGADEAMRDLSKDALFGPTDRMEGESRVGVDENNVAVHAAVIPIIERGLQWRVVVYRSEASLTKRRAKALRQAWSIGAAALLPGVIIGLLILRRRSAAVQ